MEEGRYFTLRTWPCSCSLVVVSSRVVCHVLRRVVGVAGVQVQHDVVDAVDGRGGLADRLTVLLCRGLETDWQIVRGLEEVRPDVLVLVSRVLRGVGQLLGDVEVGGGGGCGRDVTVDVVPAVRDGAPR